MVELDELEVSSFDPEMMGPIVGQIIDDVAGHESGKCGCEPMGSSDQLRPNEIKKGVKEKCQGNTGCRGHHQPGLAHRLGVMDTMEKKCHPLHPRCFRREVKNEPVQEILSKRP
jgi:hypothetical protein